MGPLRVLLLTSALAAASAPLPSWTLQTSGVDARLRGVSASSANVVWASGAAGTVIRTEDAGETWRRLTIPHSSKLDFRDIDALDDRTAVVLSIGPGHASRIYKTTDAGQNWTLQFRNEDPKAFYDAMAFDDKRRGFAVSDSVENTFVILQTLDGGSTWNRVPTSRLPPALADEGAFAASGTNVVVRNNFVWIATNASRVLRSSDSGRSWTVSSTPVASGPSAGLFSIAFRDSRHGIVVGGDFKKEAEAVDSAAITDSGGRTWMPVSGLSGFRSAVAHVPAHDRTVIAVGPSGSDVSFDDGRTWRAIPGPGFHAVSFAPRSRVAWGVGEKGAVARLEW